MYLGRLIDAYNCCIDVEKNEVRDPQLRRQLREWCEYWIAATLVDIFENFLDGLISSIPVRQKKLVILIFFCHPAFWRRRYILPPGMKHHGQHPPMLAWVFTVVRWLSDVSLAMRMLGVFTGHYTKVESNKTQMLDCKVLLRYVYPTYHYCTIVEKNKGEIEELRRWCQYWIIVTILGIFEHEYEKFISWLPMYDLLKLLFFISLSCPGAMGATTIYETLVAPFSRIKGKNLAYG
ncbi:PREDICTED: uncharacterized protein LOC104601357 [Nelumbo nucifera]|uniref:HVA22-like protein n=2 Tax=Nelumbo nucifera TaxID=4432 RepID=A0A822YBL5_NELNU|nr:PREDICTED: uncharacterized protein LOC104601357 [Nelumbo nucifera]DAD28911.1 TPA_asm: hypothetical protein HUJ06_030379 [Nelumbo nucifera]